MNDSQDILTTEDEKQCFQKESDCEKGVSPKEGEWWLCEVRGFGYGYETKVLFRKRKGWCNSCNQNLTGYSGAKVTPLEQLYTKGDIDAMCN